MAQPPWVDMADMFRGETELPGAIHNEKIVEMFRLNGQPNYKRDEIPWCAAAVGACLKLSGYDNTKSAVARSYLNFGKDLGKRPKIGAIAVLSRGGAKSGLGHVGFYMGEKNGQVLLLGGNQNNGFNVKPYAKSRLLSYRWPTKPCPLPETPLPTILDIHPANAPLHLTQPVVSGHHNDAAGLSGPPFLARVKTSEKFLRCHEMIAKWEGGYVNHPDDPGGPTNFGVTQKTLSAWRGRAVSEADVKALTFAEALELFATRFWAVIQGDQLPLPVALMTYNAAVNSGPTRGARLLQRSLTRMGFKVSIDGEIGPETLGAVRYADIHGIVDHFRDLHQGYYESLSTYHVFGRGWLNRLRDITAKAHKWADDDPLMTTQNYRGDERQPASEARDKISDTLTPIDRMLGGKRLVGRKTLIATVAYVLLIGLETFGFLPEGFVAKNITIGLPHHAPQSDLSGSPMTGISPVTVLETMLLAVAGLGALSKVERGFKSISTALKTNPGVRQR